jgi:hypothetical protein
MSKKKKKSSDVWGLKPQPRERETKEAGKSDSDDAVDL